MNLVDKIPMRKGHIVLKKAVSKYMHLLLLKLTIHITCDITIPLLGKYPMQEDMYKNLGHIQIMECHTEWKNELLIHVITWNNLRDVLLSERSQTLKVLWYATAFIQNSNTRKLICGYNSPNRGSSRGTDFERNENASEILATFKILIWLVVMWLYVHMRIHIAAC